MYSAQDAEGHGNFVSLAIKDKRVEFRYDAGNGPVVIRSDKDLEPDEYVTISAMKTSSEGRLMVSGSNPATERSTRSTPTLSLHTPLFLGGVNKGEVSVSPGVGVETGFDGCIATVCSILSFSFFFLYAFQRETHAYAQLYFSAQEYYILGLCVCFAL